MTSAPRVGVLALQGDVREHLSMLAEAGAEPRAVRSTTDLQEIAALVIPGGESTTMSKLALADGLMPPLRAARAAGMPMFGTCAGMIMISDRIVDGRDDQETIGGLAVTVRRNAFGRQVDSFEADLEVPWLGERPFRGVFIRAPRVEHVGEGVEVLATVGRDDGGSSIVAVRQGRLLATAFHPELTGDPRFHSAFVDMVRTARDS